MAKKKKVWTVDEAVAHLSKLKEAEANSSQGGLRDLFEVIRVLPEGVPLEVVRKACDFLVGHLSLSYLAGASENAWPAIEQVLLARPKQPEAVFALTGLRTEKHPEKHFSRWLQFCGLPMLGSTRVPRPDLEKLGKEPAVLEAARAAIAVTELNEVSLSRAVAVLAVDGSADSLDVLMPWLLQVVKDASHELDTVRKKFVPLLPKTPATTALLEKLNLVVETRTAQSPALQFCQAIGMNPPPKKLVFNASFFQRELTHFGHAWQMKADSTKAAWFCVRRNEKWQWRTIDPQSAELKKMLGTDLVRVTMRASGKDVDRPKLQAWLETFLAK